MGTNCKIAIMGFEYPCCTIIGATFGPLRTLFTKIQNQRSNPYLTSQEPLYVDLRDYNHRPTLGRRKREISLRWVCDVMTLLEMPIASVKLAIHFGPHRDRAWARSTLLLFTVTDVDELADDDDEEDSLGAGTKEGNWVQFSLRKFSADVSITDRATAENEQQNRLMDEVDFETKESRK